MSSFRVFLIYGVAVVSGQFTSKFSTKNHDWFFLLFILKKFLGKQTRFLWKKMPTQKKRNGLQIQNGKCFNVSTSGTFLRIYLKIFSFLLQNIPKKNRIWVTRPYLYLTFIFSHVFFLDFDHRLFSPFLIIFLLSFFSVMKILFLAIKFPGSARDYDQVWRSRYRKR